MESPFMAVKLMLFSDYPITTRSIVRFPSLIFALINEVIG